MRKDTWQRIIMEVSEGLLKTVTDLTLFQFYLLGASLGKMGKSSRIAHQMVGEASASLSELNYETIRESIQYLKRKGLIRLLKEPEITKAGQERLRTLFPVYDEKRIWDGSVYLVIYDIPEKISILRDNFREYLKKLKVGQLQQSVWITAYNPEKIVKDFVQEHGLEGSILVSCMGKGGYIGEENLQEVLKKVFNLDDVNEAYRDFLEKFRNKEKRENKEKLTVATAYLSILKNDPQLPWELLSDDWLGDKAYKLYKKLIFKTSG